MGRPKVEVEVEVEVEAGVDLALVLLAFDFDLVLRGEAFSSDFEVVSLGSGDLDPVTSLMVEESRENGELLEEVSSLSFPTDPLESTSMSWPLMSW